MPYHRGVLETYLLSHKHLACLGKQSQGREMVGRLIQRGLFVVNDVKEDYEFWLGGQTQTLAEQKK